MQAFMHVLVTYKNEDDPIKNEGARVFTRFLQLQVKRDLLDAQGQLTPHCDSPWSDLAEFRNRPRCYEFPLYLPV